VIIGGSYNIKLCILPVQLTNKAYKDWCCNKAGTMLIRTIQLRAGVNPQGLRSQHPQAACQWNQSMDLYWWSVPIKIKNTKSTQHNFADSFNKGSYNPHTSERKKQKYISVSRFNIHVTSIPFP